MKTFFHSVFAARIQGQPATAGRTRLGRRPGLALGLILLLCGLPLFSPPAWADGMDEPSGYGPPPPLPPGSDADDDAPRRDIHMGTVDHMYMGTDADGNSVMEIRPRPKQSQQQQPNVPIYIYPQVSVPGMSTGGQSGTTPGTSNAGQTGQQTGSTAPQPGR